jgi:hypothetical protein
MLRILDDILGLMRTLEQHFGSIAKRNRELADQGREALEGAGLNGSEGSGNRDGGRRHHYDIALGSMREAKASILVGEASG